MMRSDLVMDPFTFFQMLIDQRITPTIRIQSNQLGGYIKKVFIVRVCRFNSVWTSKLAISLIGIIWSKLSLQKINQPDKNNCPKCKNHIRGKRR